MSSTELVEIACMQYLDDALIVAGEFLTEPAHAEGMKEIFERWFLTSLRSLEVRLCGKEIYEVFCFTRFR